jgi:lysosomal Pro-X carboxypeptidase
MGDYPYPSSYMSGGDGELPAFPMISACSFLEGEFANDSEGQMLLMEAVRNAVAIYYNASQSLPCYALPTDLTPQNTQSLLNPWDYQWLHYITLHLIHSYSYSYSYSWCLMTSYI